MAIVEQLTIPPDGNNISRGKILASGCLSLTDAHIQNTDLIFDANGRSSFYALCNAVIRKEVVRRNDVFLGGSWVELNIHVTRSLPKLDSVVLCKTDLKTIPTHALVNLNDGYLDESVQACVALCRFAKGSYAFSGEITLYAKWKYRYPFMLADDDLLQKLLDGLAYPTE